MLDPELKNMPYADPPMDTPTPSSKNTLVKIFSCFNTQLWVCHFQPFIEELKQMQQMLLSTELYERFESKSHNPKPHPLLICHVNFAPVPQSKMTY